MNPILAATAARWWADRLRRPATFDNGDDSLVGRMNQKMARRINAVKRGGLTAERIAAFEKELACLLADMTSDYVIFGVDYEPDGVLTRAGHTAGIELGLGLLPWKTTMTVIDGRIAVREGYGAPEVELPLPEPEESEHDPHAG